MKKVMKKSLALLLCLIMAMSTAVSAFAAGEVSGIYRNNRWEYNGNGRLTISPYEVERQYIDAPYYVDDEGDTVEYDNCYYDEELEKYYLCEYFYDSLFEEVEPEWIKEIIITEGVKSLDIGGLVLCTNVQKVSIPASLDFDLGIGSEEIEETLNEALDHLDEVIGIDIQVTGDLKKLIYAIVETVEFEGIMLPYLPLTADQFTVANGNPLLKAKDGKLYTADDKVILRQSSSLKQLTFDVDPFIDPIALCGITGADVTITNAYADAFYSAKAQILTLLDYAKEEFADIPEDTTDLEMKLLRDLLYNAEPAVDEVIDLIFTLEMSLFSAKSFTVSDTNAYLTTVNGVLYNKDMTALIKYPVACGAETYDLPASVVKYSLPFLAIDPVAAVRCVYSIYGLIEMGDYDIDVKEELSKVVLIPGVAVNAGGRDLNAYFEGGSHVEALFYNALDTVLDYFIEMEDLRDILGDDLVTNLKSLSTSAVQIALGIVKLIGTSKIILTAVSDEYKDGIFIYNGVIDALHALTDVARAVAKGSKKQTLKALTVFLKGDLFVRLLGEAVTDGLYDLVEAIFDSDYPMFKETLFPLGAELLTIAANLVEKYELQEVIATLVGVDAGMIDTILENVPLAVAFLRDPSYKGWKAICDVGLDVGLMDAEIYAEVASETAYNELMNELNSELNELFAEVSAAISYFYANAASPDFAIYIVLINTIANAVDAVVDLFPQEIVIGEPEPHDHVAGTPVMKNNTVTNCTVGGTYDLVTYCSVCGAEMDRETVTVTPRAHEFGDWKPSRKTESGYARTCSICGLLDPFVPPEEPEKVLENPEDGVVIEGSSEAIEPGVTLETERISNSVESEDYVEEWFMVKLMKDGVEVQPKEPIVLKLEYPSWVKDPKNLQLWHYTNGRWVRMNTWLEDPNFICCVTDSLSPFKWTEEIEEPDCVPGEPVKENVVAATCTTAGSYDEVIYCTIHDNEIMSSKTITEAALGHDYNAVVTEPTCTAGGFTTYTCSRCDDNYTADEKPAAGHSFGDWTQTKAPTIYETGEETRSCANCEAKETRNIQKLPMPVITIENFTPEKSLDYRSTITFKANVENAIAGGQIHWFVDGKEVGTDNSYTVKEAKNSFSIQAKYTDGDNELSVTDTEKVNVNTGFFAKLKAFFRALFKKLPVVVQEYLGIEMIDRVLP